MAKNAYQMRGATAYFDQLMVAAMDMWLPEAENQWKTDDADLAWLLEKKNTDYFSGGNQFIVPLEISGNPTVAWRKEGAGVPLDNYDPLDAATYWVKELSGGVVHTKQEQRIVRGDKARMNLFAVRVTNTINTVRQELQLGMWQGAGGNSDEMDGLPNLVPATAAASQTVVVGNISPATYSWWRSQYINMGGASFLTDAEDNLLHAYNDIKTQGGKVDINFTDQLSYEVFTKIQMSYLVGKVTKIGDHTFDLVQFMQQPIIWSPYAPANQWRCLTSKSIKFCVDPQYWMAWTEPKEIANVPFARVKQIVSDCNMARVSARQNLCIANYVTT